MRKSRLSWYKQKHLIELFVAGTTARTAASLVGVNKTTASYYFKRLRELIYANSEYLDLLSSEIENDENYFNGRKKDKKYRLTRGKVAVFGLLQRQDKIFVVMVHNTKNKKPSLTIRKKVSLDSLVYINSDYRRCSILDVSDSQYFQSNHDEFFARKCNHIGEIENFWRQAKRHLMRFNGVPIASLHLYLKECEWRFNNRDAKAQLKQLIQWVKREMS